MSKQVLFVCTGNYYRSRFAEILFNNRAAKSGWVAVSRGLEPYRVSGSKTISPYALKALKRLKIRVERRQRPPLQLMREDLEVSDLTIALKEEEHRPMMAAQFPDWVDRIDYWHVHDIDVERPEKALAELHRLVLALIDELGREVPAVGRVL